MKTLKFMLAAATAIGLASASQAGLYEGATDFEGMDLGAVDVSASSLFQYAGATAADNESEIVESATPAGVTRPKAFRNNATGAKALKVSTGTDPLLRRLQSGTGAELAGDGEVYIDTLVQFTVTPASDTVTATSADKLMVYLQETTNEVAGVIEYTTNLVVKTCYYMYDDLDGQVMKPRDVNTGVYVAPNTWQRLVVKASSFEVTGSLDEQYKLYLPVFQIWVGTTDGSELNPLTQLVSSSEVLVNANGNSDTSLFPSLQGVNVTLGSDFTKLTAVGFAGEGMVDDLVMTTVNPFATSYDFTLTLGSNVSSVSFTIGSDEYMLAAANSPATYDVYPDDVVTIGQVSYAQGYEAGATNVNGFASEASPAYTVGTANVTIELLAAQSATGIDFTLTLDEGVSAVTFTLGGNTYTTNATPAEFHFDAAGEATISSVTYDAWYAGGVLKQNGTFTVADGGTTNVDAVALGDSSDPLPAGTNPSDVGISNTEITSTDLNKVLVWAKTAYGSDSAGLTAALTAINGMVFTEGSENTAAKAYLFNCTEAQVPTAEANFKFPAITPGTVPALNEPLYGPYNGTPTIYGGAAVDAITVTPPTGEHKFYKAKLVK